MFAYMLETTQQKCLELFMATLKSLQHDGSFLLCLGAGHGRYSGHNPLATFLATGFKWPEKNPGRIRLDLDMCSTNLKHHCL